MQTEQTCSILSDMYSLGMVICAIFNSGRSLIQANNSNSAYLKQLEVVSNNCKKIYLYMKNTGTSYQSASSSHFYTSSYIYLKTQVQFDAQKFIIIIEKFTIQRVL